MVWVSWDNPAMTEDMERGEAVSEWNKKLGGNDWGCGSAGEHSPSVCKSPGFNPTYVNYWLKRWEVFPLVSGKTWVLLCFPFFFYGAEDWTQSYTCARNVLYPSQMTCLLDSLHMSPMTLSSLFYVECDQKWRIFCIYKKSNSLRYLNPFATTLESTSIKNWGML